MGEWLHVLRAALGRLVPPLPGRRGFPPQRRRHARLIVRLPVECWLEGEAGDRLAGVTENLSQEGLCLLCNTVFLHGRHLFYPTPARPHLRERPLILEVTFPSGEQARTRVEPVWFDRAADGSAWRFRVGVRFVDPPPETREAVTRLLRASARTRGEPGLPSRDPLTPLRPTP